MLEPMRTLLMKETETKKKAPKPKAKHNWRDLFKKRIDEKTEQGLLLTGLRLREGYTQKQLGNLIGVSQTNVCAMENGRRPISKKTAQKLAALFKVKYQRFL